MEIFTVLKYVSYLAKSKYYKGYGIHSPFIFSLVSEIFQNKTDPEIVFKIEEVRNKLSNDNRSVLVNDLGAGSKKMRSRERKIADIVRYTAIPRKYGKLLYNLSSAFGDELIIEFGTSLGISTMYMAAGSRNAKIFTMEGCRVLSDIAIKNFRECGLSNIILITGDFNDLIQQIRNLNKCPGLIFIDGNHRKDPTINYFNRMAEISGDDTVIVFDDIYGSREMADAWHYIKNDVRVTSSVDIFKMGLIFFRKGLTPYNYEVRY